MVGLLPANEGKEGRPFADHRLMLNACFWHLHTGSPWRDLPERFGPWQTAYNRFRRWRDDGTFGRMLDVLRLTLDADGRIDYETWCADSSVTRAHFHAAGAGKKGASRSARGPRARPRQGRLRHEVKSGNRRSRPTPGRDRRGGGTAARLPRADADDEQGPRRSPHAADGADGRQRLRLPLHPGVLKSRGIRPPIPRRRDQRHGPGRRPWFDRVRYKGRNVIERAVREPAQGLPRSRATRYDDKLASSYLAQVDLAMIKICLRELRDTA